MRVVQGFPHIYKRGSWYVYRREVPEKVRPRIQRTRNGKLRREWVHSLKTTRLDVAERKAAALAAEHDRIMAAGRICYREAHGKAKASYALPNDG